MIHKVIITFILVLETFQIHGFGMNKPHYMFHLGDRRPVSTNFVWGYWAGNEGIRMKYKNTNDGIYVNTDLHDGERIFEENVDDKSFSIKSKVKYQMNEYDWESEIEMEIEENDEKKTDEVTWFVCATVENNDYKLVDKEGYGSFISLSPQYSKANTINIIQDSKQYPSQKYTVSHNKKAVSSGELLNENESKLEIFGLIANISETYDLRPISDAFRRVIRLEKGLEEPIKGKEENDKKIKDWEERQVQRIRESNWTNQNYMVIFIYGTLKKGEKSTIYLTNSTAETSFNHTIFKEKSSEVFENHAKYLTSETSEKSIFVNHVLSNLFSGIAFYYGRLYTQNSLTVHKQDYSYSFTPSRLIFPRSFLWDDGFHQSIAVHYKPHVVLEMLTGWMSKVDLFGWIGREQIRGAEVSSMMPDERFVFQDWFEMNPPTLVLPILSLIEKAKSDERLDEELELFLKNNFHKLEKWYRYFKNTQSHQSLEYSELTNKTSRFFRWHCKDECSKGNFMGSGLDDYPRRTEDTEVAKEHVDLVSWLYLFSKSLSEIGEYMQNKIENTIIEKREKSSGNEKDYSRGRNRYNVRVEFYKKEARKYTRDLFEKFYDSSDNLFKDIVVEKQNLFIEKFVNKIGYINLFPFFTGMLSADFYSNGFEEESLKKCLQIMTDESLLLSQDGLRSLSFSDELYGTEENYWRGAVWLPINYMVLRACKLYYWNHETLQEEVRKTYYEIRKRLISSIEKNYKESGYLYENYYEGKGHRGYPFYGWTSTIVNIITEKY